MAASVRIIFNPNVIGDKLRRVEIAMDRLTVLGDAVKHALQPTVSLAKDLAPKDGMPGYTPRRGKRAGKATLESTITAIARIYPRSKVILGVAGPRYPRGSHGHLVESGHRIVYGGSVTRIGKYAKKVTSDAKRVSRTGKGRVVGQVAGKPFLEPAAAQTKASAQSHFEGAVAKFVDAALRAMNG